MSVILEPIAFMGFLVAFYWLCKLGAYLVYLWERNTGRTSANTWEEYTLELMKED